MKDLEEQSVCVKFYFKLGKTFTETFQLLQQAYREDCLSRKHCHEWYQRILHLVDNQFVYSCSCIYTDVTTQNSRTNHVFRHWNIDHLLSLCLRRRGCCPCINQYFNLLKPKRPYMYHQVKHSQILRSAHLAYLCVFMDFRTNSDYLSIPLFMT